MATTNLDSSFNFDVKELTVKLTFGTLSGVKTFANFKELETAKEVFDNTLKAMKQKKSTASLKAELFSIFSIDSTAKSTVVKEKQSEKKEDLDKGIKNTLTPTTHIQVGKTVTFVIDGTKYSKVFDEKDDRDATKSLFKDITSIEQKDVFTKVEENKLGKLKNQVKELMLANTLKQEKELKEVEIKTKAIDKEIAKLEKEPSVKIVTPNKNLLDLIKEENNLSETDMVAISNIINKKKTVEPVATVAKTTRRGEY